METGFLAENVLQQGNSNGWPRNITKVGFADFDGLHNRKWENGRGWAKLHYDKLGNFVRGLGVQAGVVCAHHNPDSTERNFWTRLNWRIRVCGRNVDPDLIQEMERLRPNPAIKACVLMMFDHAFAPIVKKLRMESIDVQLLASRRLTSHDLMRAASTVTWIDDFIVEPKRIAAAA